MARRFRFRLETVRKMRQQERDVQQREVARAAGEVGRVEDQISILSGQLKGTLAESRGVQSQAGVNLSLLRGHHYYRGWLHRCLLESKIDLGDCKVRYEAERSKLAEKSKRLKVIETLRERQWQQHRRDLAREEQATSDEAALQMHRRRKEFDHEVIR